MYICQYVALGMLMIAVLLEASAVHGAHSPRGQDRRQKAGRAMLVLAIPVALVGMGIAVAGLGREPVGAGLAVVVAGVIVFAAISVLGLFGFWSHLRQEIRNRRSPHPDRPISRDVQ